MYGLVAPCYRLIQNILYKKHLLLLLRIFFFSLSDFFQGILSCCSLSQMYTPNLYIKPFVALVTFFSLPFLIFFKIFSLVAVCHRRIHHCLYIIPFVALVTLFVSTFLFFLCIVMLLFVTDGYKIFPIEIICRTCLHIFSQTSKYIFLSLF